MEEKEGKGLSKYINPPDEWFHYPQFESVNGFMTHLFFIGFMVSNFSYPDYKWYWLWGGFAWIIGYSIYEKLKNQGDAGAVNKD